ncbi:sugar phosphate isomerase/epimerase [Aliifodinibius sp. S!AR15-10]|uniref:sugar phosphate isomerase/epimerase family protein n=1 Tax=Aliifodinibius sp. S!AR15-10 TaxID=2950437 RepID=UPI0028627443|nr:sugar phosphate isomerase/epimerase family protein [Aliifodinibius sp. S!AR15-10]MDR8393644.1 sugar phosphate isomerase/epimerase [Aliifodinibius sp. S!AR15-10]
MALSFGVSTWVWTSPFNSETVQLFPKIKKMGFDVVEIPVEDPDLVDGPRVKESLREHGLEAVICGAFGPGRDFTSDDPSIHQDCFDYMDALMDLADQLDTGFVAGPMYSAVGKARMVSPEQRKTEWKRAVTNLREVAKKADDRGLELAIEPLNRFESDLINTTEDALRLVNDIDHDAAKIMVDGFHMSIEEHNLEEAIKVAGDKLIHVQVSENYRGTPGTGQTDWDSFRRGLEAIDYSGYVNIESFTSDNQELADAVCIWKPFAEDQDQLAEEGLAFIKETFKIN